MSWSRGANHVAVVLAMFNLGRILYRDPATILCASIGATDDLYADAVLDGGGKDHYPASHLRAGDRIGRWNVCHPLQGHPP